MKLPRIFSKFRKKLMPVSGRWFTIQEQYPGQWQQNVSIELDSVLTFGAVFACIRLISSDIGKLRIKLMRQSNDIWRETELPSFAQVLRKPNPHQTRIKFIESWLISKLVYGNAYILKTRSSTGVVVSLRVLDPTRVSVLISRSGDVFYKLRTDEFAGVQESEVTVPAREVIHDVHLAIEHPLVGVSPLGACGLAATQGLKIQGNSAKLFTNMSRPSGFLTAPGAIGDDTASRLKTSWDTNYGGDNYGKTAVLGDGLEYKPMITTPVDAQLIEQLNWTAVDVCTAFGVPPYKIGVGQMPAYNNINAMDQSYYSQTLQELIECVELLLDEGLEYPGGYMTQLDLDGLLRMDALTSAQVDKELVKAGIKAPNEARIPRGLLPVPGGDAPYLQHQNYSLEALAKRDAKDDPFSPSTSPVSGEELTQDEDEEDPEEVARFYREAVEAA